MQSFPKVFIFVDFIVIVFSFLQPENAFCPIDVTFFPIVTDLSDILFDKAFFGNLSAVAVAIGDRTHNRAAFFYL